MFRYFQGTIRSMLPGDLSISLRSTYLPDLPEILLSTCTFLRHLRNVQCQSDKDLCCLFIGPKVNLGSDLWVRMSVTESLQHLFET